MSVGNTLIQILRSNTTAIPVSLANGQLAVTSNGIGGDILYVGSNSAIVAIGGKRVPGILTANQALVMNANGFINLVQTNKLIIGPDGTTQPNISFINTVANSTVLGSNSNTELTSTWAIKTYINGQLATANPAGSDTDVQFNDGGSLNGTAGLTFAKTSNTVTIANTLLLGTTASLNSSAIYIQANSSVNVTSNGSALIINGQVNTTVNSSLLVNTSFFTFGNSTANASMTNASFTIANSTVSTALGTGSVTVGANATLNTSTLFIGNSTVNAVHNSSVVLMSGNLQITTTTFQVGNSTVNTVVNSTFISTAQANLSTGFNVGANVIGNTTAYFVGNSTVNSVIASATATLGGTLLVIGNTTIQGANLFFSGANANFTANTILGGTNTVVSSNLTVTGANLSVTGANTSFTTNTTIAGTNTLISSNVSLTGANLYVTGANTNFTSNVTLGGTNTVISSNLTLSGGASFNAPTSLISARDLTLTGNLTVTGTLTAIDSTSLVVEDGLILLANGNFTTNVIDIGFYGTYGNSTQTYYNAFYRDHADGITKLVVTQKVPTTTVDSTNNTWQVTTLQAYLLSGALVSNVTSVYITANSTVNVNITANTLALSSALPVTSGGTGLASLTNNAVLVGNTASNVALVTGTVQGQVFQVDSAFIPFFGMIDCGVF